MRNTDGRCCAERRRRGGGARVLFSQFSSRLRRSGVRGLRSPPPQRDQARGVCCKLASTDCERSFGISGKSERSSGDGVGAWRSAAWLVRVGGRIPHNTVSVA